MTKKESQNGSTMGINHYTINEKVSKTRVLFKNNYSIEKSCVKSVIKF